MATRSNIAYKTPEGKIRSVYAHWDGYPVFDFVENKVTAEDLKQIGWEPVEN